MNKWWYKNFGFVIGISIMKNMNKDIEDLIIKFLSKEADLDELRILEIWIGNPKNEILFYELIKANAYINMTYGIYDEERAKASILRRIKKERSVFRNRSKVVKSLKYAAVAAMVAVVLTTTLIFKDVMTTAPLKSDPVHVNSNIKPGTDRATLILEDGTSVVLEKGSSFRKQNIDSNGERVVYEPLEKDIKETVYNILNVPRGGQFYLKLSDGTEVWLNSETQLKYPVAFLEGETRKVELVYGEAYFNVTPSTAHQGAKFEVLNNGQQLEVLGTKFNIKAYKDESNIYTTLVEGSVQINTSNVKKVLVPNQQSSVNIFNNEIYVEHVDVENEISWINGIFSFKGKSLKDIMKVLSRWYDVDIVFENNDMEEVRFRGTLDKGQAIGEILSIMKSNTINNYEIKGGTIIIK